MKYIPAFLLLAYAIYSAFIQISIAHSIVLFSLAGLFAYNQFLLSREQPSLQTEIAKLKSELEQQVQKHKEIYEVKLSGMEGELQKIAMSQIKAPSTAPSSKPEARKYIF